MSQPIQAAQRRSADSSPLITPSGTPPPTFFHSHFGQNHTLGLHHFFAAASASTSGAMESGPSEKRRDSESSGPIYSGRIDTAPRHSIPFFSGLSISRPHPQTYASQPAHQHLGHSIGGVAMAKSATGDSSSSCSIDSGAAAPTARPDAKRAATLPVDVAVQALPKRHYDPCREPKLLHFM